MTQLLQQAFDAANRLEPEKQDAIAAIILEEIADEVRWDASFAKSQDQLAKLADEARRDVAAGRFVNKGFDEL